MRSIISQALTWPDYVEDRFIRDAHENGWGVFRSESWVTEREDLVDIYPQMRKILKYSEDFQGIYLTDETKNISAMVERSPDGKVYVKIAGQKKDAVDSFYNTLRQKIGGVKESDGMIPLEFWYKKSTGQASKVRQISVPPWPSISDNYSSATRSKLEYLTTSFKPERGGQLLLWHGHPGTGKTYALRSLIHEWRRWCRFEYIVDPENFFSADPGYLMNVLLNPRSHEWRWDDDEESVFNLDDDGERWRLLIFEDTGELLSEQARINTGQGLSRLLNTVDGLIGQGLKILVLITTNEEIGKLHPAVSRPGRTASSILFEALSAEESVEWAKKHEVTLDSVKRHNLADLYAMKHGLKENIKEAPALGFVLDKST